MNTFTNILIAAHILLAIVIFGPLITFGIVVPGWIRKGPDMAKPVAAMTRALDHIGRSTLLVFVLGLLIVAQSKAYSFKDKWIGPSMGLFVVVVILGFAVIAPAANKASAKLAAGETALAEAKKLQIANAISSLLVIAILWLMVAKPGG